MTTFQPGIFRKEIEEAQEQPVEADFTEALMDDLGRDQRPPRSPYAEALMSSLGSGRTAVDGITAFLQETGIQDPGTIDVDSFSLQFAEALMENPLGAVASGSFSQELTKGILRGTLNMLALPTETQAMLARTIRQQISEPLLRKFGVGEEVIEATSAAFRESGIEAVGREGRKELNKLVQGPGFLAPKPQDRIFAWDDPDWWAGQAGESLVFLLATLGVGVTAGIGAKAAGFGPTALNAIRIGAAASTSGMIEANLSRADFVEALMAKGMTEDEALRIADLGALGVGIVNGVLDVIPLERFLRTGTSRHLITSALTTMAVEAVTESAQEATIIVAERVLDIDQPGTEFERILAAGSVGAVIAGPVSIGPSVASRLASRESAAPTPVPEIEANTPAQAAEARRRVLGKGEPLTAEEREFVDVSRQDSESEVLIEIQGLNEEERAVARETFDDVIESGLHPFTGEPLTDEQMTQMVELREELNSVQEAVAETPDEAFTTPVEEQPDGAPLEAQVEPPPEGAPETQEERQAEEEGAKREVADLAQEADPEAEEGGVVVKEEPEAPARETPTFPETLQEVGRRFPEVGEKVQALNSLSERINNLLEDERPREAARLQPDLAQLKAEVNDLLTELKATHGTAGGQFDVAARGAVATGDTVQASVDRLVDTVRDVAGGEAFDAAVAVVQPDSPQGALEREARRIGLAITYFEPTGDVAVPAAHDPYGTGRRILLNVNEPLDNQLKAIFSHEVVHALQRASLAAWEKFYNRVAVLDPDGLRASGRAYWELLTAGETVVEADFDRWFDSAQGRNESVARYVEERATDADFYNRVIGDRNLLTILRDIVRRLINVFGLTGLDQRILIEVEKLADTARKTFTETTPEIDTEIAGRVNLALQRPFRGRRVRRQVEEVTGVKKGTVSETEAKALRRVLKEQRKVGEQAFREGLSSATGRVLNVLEGVFGRMGMQVTQRQIERMQRARAARSPEQVAREGIRLMEDQVRLIRLRMLEDARGGRASIQRVKRQITDAVRRNLTGRVGQKMQGRFLGDVARAETVSQLHVAMKRIELSVGQAAFVESVNDMRKVERKAKRFRRMTNDLRQQIDAILGQAKLGAFTPTNRVRTFRTRVEYDKARDSALDAVDAVEALLAIRRAETNQINADKARTVEGHVGQIEQNMAGIKGLKGRSKAVQDKTTGLVKRGLIALLDVANLSRHAEGQWKQEGVLAALLDRTQKDVEEDYNADRRDETDNLDKMIRENTGYRNLAEAQMRMQGTLGEANQQFAKVTIGGEQVTLSIDTIGELVAIDDRTLAGVVESGFQPEGARQTEPLRPTLSEIQEIRQEWAPKFGDLIVAMKGNIETLKPRTFKVATELKGREPVAEPPGYWPSTRNLSAAPDFGLSADFRAFMQSATRRWLENAGFLQERTGGKSPFVMRGLLRTYMDHVDQSMKIIHLAVPVRDAAAVLLNPRTVQSINRVHGSEMNDILQKHLIEATRINQDTDGGPDRRIRTLNTNMVGTWLVTNVGTFIRQIGGAFRVAAKMPLKHFLTGLRNLQPGTFAEMKNNSGFFWDRYEGDSAARYSPMRGQGLAGMDFSSFGQAFGALMRSVSKADFRGGFRSWTGVMRSIKVLDWFDAIPGRISWEGRKAQVREENPNFTDAQVLRETSRLAADDMRSTQNTSSPLDSASLAVAWRNNPLRYFLLFTTDPNKSLNFLIRSWHESPGAGFKASVGVAGNAMWSAYVVTLGLQYSTDLIASMLGAAFGRDPDEVEREKQRIRSWEKANIRMVQEVLGLSFFGDELQNAWLAVSQPFRRDDVFRAPIGQTVSDTLLGGAEAGQSIWHGFLALEDGLTDEEKDKFTTDMIDGTVRTAKGASTLIGNPFLMPWYRVKPIKDQLFPEDEATEARGDLNPEVR